MPLFAYTAVDARGREKSGAVDAADARRAAADLRRQGLYPTRVAPAADALPAAPPAPARREPRHRGRRYELGLPWARRVGGRELALFTRQLGTLLRACMPLLRGLEVLARQERNPDFRRVIEGLAAAIRSGGTLSEAMAPHPRVFDRLYVNMIKAGEAGGVLDVVLERLARFQEKSLQLRARIKSAMVYPLVVMAVALAILAGLLVFVVPRFKQIFADLLKGAPLPALTQGVLTISDVIKGHYLVVAAAALGGWTALQLSGRTSGGRRWRDGLAVRLPLVGELYLKGLVARFGRTFGTLLASGVPILPALLITRDTCGSARVAGAITVVHDRVKAGAPVAQSLEATRAFPPMVTSLVEVGEQTGHLPDMLGKVADIYEEEVDTAVAGLSSLLEPALILFLAVVVGTIVIALFLPIVRIVQLLT